MFFLDGEILYVVNEVVVFCVKVWDVKNGEFRVKKRLLKNLE